MGGPGVGGHGSQRSRPPWWSPTSAAVAAPATKVHPASAPGTGSLANPLRGGTTPWGAGVVDWQTHPVGSAQAESGVWLRWTAG